MSKFPMSETQRMYKPETVVPRLTDHTGRQVLEEMASAVSRGYDEITFRFEVRGGRLWVKSVPKREGDTKSFPVQ